MKHKRLSRDGTNGWGFEGYPYVQTRIERVDFRGLAGLCRSLLAQVEQEQRKEMDPHDNQAAEKALTIPPPSACLSNMNDVKSAQSAERSQNRYFYKIFCTKDVFSLAIF